jgi:excisionase family DNA binding protein
MSGKLWSVKEVAEYLGLAVGTVYHLLSEKRLPCVRISGRCVRFDPRRIEEWVAERAEEPREFNSHVTKLGVETRERKMGKKDAA